ncbi:MAG TPA: MFS transporter [Anaeromyxobacteraceae bacterium]|nr:MFS transporter [Anaeromyxobacteraceae bacterium]
MTHVRTSLFAGAAGRTLLLLAGVNLLNYLDRFVVSALVESLRAAFSLSDLRLGVLMTSFMVVYTVASPVFGALGDRGRRPALLAVGVGVWSFATVLSGAATGFASLLFARAAVGVGEAAYATISPSLIADHFERARRGRAFALFFAAIPVGSALGYVVGGLLDHAFGWRAAFLAAGLPGLVLALLVLRQPDPPRGQHDGAPAGGPRPLLQSWRALAGIRPYVLAVLGYAAYSFATGALAFWMPAFLERTRGVPRAEATIQFGAVVVLTGLAGTLLGGWIADALRRRIANADLWVSGLSALAAAPLALVALTAPSKATWLAALVVGQLCLFASTGPINDVIVAVVPPAERATASAVSIFVLHALGDVPSPPLVGALSDRTSLANAILLVPAAILLSGFLWTWGAVQRHDPRAARG